MRTRVKVCCVASVEEMLRASSLGADAIGLVSAMPSGPGVIGDDLIAEIAAAAPYGLRVFLLTSRTEPEKIAGQVRATGVDTVQLVSSLPDGGPLALRRLLPETQIVQVVHVTGESSVAQAVVAARDADELLLDSGNPSAPLPELGGTGRVHDWALSRRIVEAAPVPVWLAGGLTPENVGQAVDKVQPYGVDVCTGVRTDGRLDPLKLRRFLNAIG